MKKNILFITLIFTLWMMCFAENESLNNSINIEDISIIKEKKKDKKMPKMDIDFRFYLPSLAGITTGNNPYMKLRNNENSLNVTNSISFMLEGRGEIATINKVSFAFGFGCEGYVEIQTNDEHRYSAFEISLGAGVYYRPFFEKYSLSGSYLFVYPVFNLPVYVLDDSTNSVAYGANDYYWKIATDLGYSLSIFDIVTFSPYMRTIIGWLDGDVDVGLDFGFTVGFYFHDRNYSYK